MSSSAEIHTVGGRVGHAMISLQPRVEKTSSANSHVCQIGVIDLSHELIRKEGFKSLSWWQDEETLRVHAFLVLGIPAISSLAGSNPVEDFSDWLPWLNLKSVHSGAIQPMDVFADNELDWGCADFAGVYLGSLGVPAKSTAQTTAIHILGACNPAMQLQGEALLWGLWTQDPYVYPPQTPTDDRCVKSAHQLTFSAEQTILATKSVTLL